MQVMYNNDGNILGVYQFGSEYKRKRAAESMAKFLRTRPRGPIAISSGYYFNYVVGENHEVST